ncbi:hypothetical protein LSH36_196g03007 [Paralvinella palmiformis]|uniref:SSD domain-containing protein n=1 Tax=Paralvinella palmiformis TaxID=53620 RepID=A0AAD9JQN6_9ANNE|nr:hypothetical protein LSH36_196g03007 [Paralvinella palmiformis]
MFRDSTKRWIYDTQSCPNADAREGYRSPKMRRSKVNIQSETKTDEEKVKNMDGDIRSHDPIEYDRRSSKTSVSSRSTSADSYEKSRCSKCKENACLRRLNNIITTTLEKAFYSFGFAIGTKPWLVLLWCVAFTAAFIPGLIFFWQEEYAPDKLWVPDGSQALHDKQFVDEHFPLEQRFELMIPVGGNILTSASINQLLDLDIVIKSIVTEPNGYTWDTLCTRLGTTCWSNSILELWSFNETIIRSLTEDDILDTINTVSVSPVYGGEYNVSQVLGEITTDPSTGEITGAEATLMQWVLKSNFTEGQGESADVINWEEQFLEIGGQGISNLDTLYYFATKSFMDEAVGAILDDVVLLAMGYMLVIVFISVVLGRFTRIRHRIYVAFAGVICVGMAIIVSYGLCSYIGLFYGPLHSVLPFLLLGIGVDDTFVICQNLDQLPDYMTGLSSRERIGYALKHAGVSITVTSLTDILAFGVGAVTTIPALWSFCAYAAVGVLATYIFQTTFLVACLVYDDIRVNEERNACCCCIVHQDDVPSECSNKLIVQGVFDRIYAPNIIKLPSKICVIISAATLLGVSIWGVLNLEQEFDITWFLPRNSYARKFTEATEYYFPSSGTPAGIYFGDINFYTDYNKLEDMYFELRNNKFVASSTVGSWYYSYRVWMNETSHPLAPPLLGPEDNFYQLLRIYLFVPTDKFSEPDGARFIMDLKFNETNRKILDASRMRFQYITLEGAAMEIEAMDNIRALVDGYGYPQDDNFVYALNFLVYEGNKVIKKELFRNLGLAFICIFLMTLILLDNFVACLLVCLCVIMSLIDVGGCMQFWGLTIDEVTAINLIVAIGLTVDYSAHVTHCFISNRGSRNERVEKTLKHVGPPVFYGGFSTFLAFVLLASSDSYVFMAFFQIFLLVVIFGLFHGLVLMPVLLSWIGPSAYVSSLSEPIIEDPQDEKTSPANHLDASPGTTKHHQTSPNITRHHQTSPSIKRNNGITEVKHSIVNSLVKDDSVDDKSTIEVTYM